VYSSCDDQHSVFTFSRSPFHILARETGSPKLHALDLESSFMLFAKWKNLRRLKLEYVEHMGPGKFFIQVNVLYIYIYIYKPNTI